MAFVINDKVINEKLTNNLEKSRQKNIDSLEKLSSGKVFTATNPQPASRALAEKLEFRLRSLSASKRNINDAVSLLQTAEDGLSEINNIMTRMKEINVSAASTTLDDKDRRYLFIEYEALYDEINRIAKTTTFNGLPLLNGESEETPEELIFRLDDPTTESLSGDEDDLNTIRFDGIKSVIATTEGLGIRSARELLIDSEDEGGIEIDDAQELMEPDDSDLYVSVYDEALDKLSTHRAVFGAMQNRLNKAVDYNSVLAENIAAAKSKIEDTDYAVEVTNMAHNNILTQATTGLLAQNNMNSHSALSLLGAVLK